MLGLAGDREGLQRELNIDPTIHHPLRDNLQMSDPELGGVSPLFIVKDVPATLAFYRDRLGFEITFQGPEPDDIFFGIVQRGRAMIMFKDVGVEAVPNHVCDIGQGIARWDAYIHVPNPDALAAEFLSRNVESSLRAVLRPSSPCRALRTVARPGPDTVTLRHIAQLHEQLPCVWNGLRISRQRSKVGPS